MCMQMYYLSQTLLIWAFCQQTLVGLRTWMIAETLLHQTKPITEGITMTAKQREAASV